MRSIVYFFAKEHLFGNLLTILILVFGLYTVAVMKRDIFPPVDYDFTIVTTVMGGASPEQVEKLLVNPVESALREVDGIKMIRSTATESKAVVVVQIDPDSRDPDKTNDDIQRAIDRIEDLPDEVEKPIVTVVESGQLPVLEVTVAGDLPDLEIRNVAKFLGDELRFVEGVSKVTKQGFRDIEYLVESDPVKLAERRVPLSLLIDSVRRRNVSIPGGSVEGKNHIEALVRTEGQYQNPEEILDTFLLSNEVGFGTKIGDVATVEKTLADPDLIYHSEGQPSINLVVAKKRNSDALELVRNIKSKMTELKGQISDKINIGYSNDFSVYLVNRLGALSWNLIIGLLLVVIILTFFLPWQVTLVVSAGIPVALLSALGAAFLMGITINLISLIGLIIVLGMLVDDAIVVSENVWRHAEMGKSITSAVTEGSAEVFKPVLASILTTVSAFGPMLFMTGIFGAFVFQIPVMVILALAFSLLEAFIIMPSHFTSWVGPSLKRIKDENLKVKKQHWFDGVTERYYAYVQWSLDRRYWILTIVVVMFVGTTAVMTKQGRFVLFPPEGVEMFFVQAEAPTGVALKEMENIITPIEKRIIEFLPNELKDVTTSIGIIQQDPFDPQTKRGSYFANIRVALTPKHEREKTADDIMKLLKEKIPKPDGLRFLTFAPLRQGPPQGRPISIDIKGNDFDILREISSLLEQELKSVEGVIEVRNSFLPGKKEWQVIPRHKDSAVVGVSALDVSQTVRAAFEGIVASSIRTLDEEIDIRVKLKPSNKELDQQLPSLEVGNRFGQLTALRDIADFQQVEAMNAIQHVDHQRMINVSGEVNLETTTAREATALLKPKVAAILNRYPGYSAEWGGEDKDTAESMQSLLVAFIFAACIIFALLITTFKSILQPLLILVSIPLGFMGVAYAMLLHNRPLSFMAMLGVIALAGVIVNNAIVFTDFVNANRNEGKGLNDSIAIAAKVRLRPIFLTTITTVFGLLPTAYGGLLRDTIGIGGSDPFIVPIALALGWGLAFGSVMTGIFFPALIRISDDLRWISSQAPKS